MAKDTADFSSRHQEHYQDEQLDHPTKDPATAYTDFINRLDERHPDVAKDLREEHHPLSNEHNHAWLDPKRRDEVVSHIHTAFRDATEGMDHDNRYAVAQQISDKLTGPLTYPAQLIAETYENANNEHLRDNVKYYQAFLATASGEATTLNGVAASTIASHLSDDDTHYTTIADDLATLEDQAQQAHINYIAYSLSSAWPEGADQNQKAEHAKALGDALAYPLMNKLEDQRNPFNEYQEDISDFASSEYHLPDNKDDHRHSYNNAEQLAHSLERQYHWDYDTNKNQLESITRDLVSGLSQTEHTSRKCNRHSLTSTA